MINQNEHKRFLKKIIELLNTESDFNYDAYKEATIIRRIEKRMKALKVDSFNNYYKYLKKNQDEFNLLSKDIFINVSFFFRDKAVFNHIGKKIIPKLLEKKPDKSIRIWVSGCATGEEAYTMAIVLNNLQKGGEFEYKIIASDIDKDALSLARLGVYSKQVLNKLSQSTIETYFEHFNDQLKVRQFIKDNLIFTHHDLLSDPPFGKMDLILCRNVLIYINGKDQEGILHKFSFSLNTNGYLILGKSESPTFIDKNFTTENKVLKIFKKLYTKDRYLQFDKTNYKPIQTNSFKYDISNKKMNNTTTVEFKDYIYQHYQPAIVIINQQLQIQYVTKQTIQYVQNPEDLTGSANFNQVFSNEIVAVVKSAILSLSDKNKEWIFEGFKLPNGSIIHILCKIVKLLNIDANFFSVEFRKPTHSPKAKKISVEKINATLKNQLEKTENDLQETILKLEKTNQNLESFNEELQSTNEEYLSVNEELQSINLEYQSTIDELSQANIYIDSLMQSTQIGTLFLDKDLKIKKFTKPIAQLINITEFDIGRPIHHFTHQFLNDEWQKLIKKFFKTGKIIDVEIKDRSDNWYLVKIRSYKLQNERRKGASISFVNINSIKKVASELKESELLFKSIFNATNDGFVLYNVKELRAVKVNEHLLKLYNITEKDFFNTPTLKFFPDIKLWDKSAIEKKQLLEDIISNFNTDHTKWLQKRKDGTTFWAQISCIAMPAPFDDYCINVIKDITEREIKNKQLKESELLFRTVFEYANDGFVLSNHVTDKIEKVNQQLLDYEGYSLDEYLNLKPVDRLPKYQLDGTLSMERRKRLVKLNKLKKSYKFNWLIKRKNGTTFIAEVNTVKLPEPFESLQLNIVRDISESVKHQNQLKSNAAQYRAYFDNNMFGVIHIGLDGEFLDVNKAFLQMLGYTKKQLQNKRLRDLTHPDDKNLSKQKLKLLQNKKVENYIIYKRYLTKKGKPVFVKVYVTGIFDENNAFTSYYATIINRTEELQLKKTIERSEEKYKNYFEDSLLATIQIDLAENILEPNDTFCKMLDYDKNELVSLRLKDILSVKKSLLQKKTLGLMHRGKVKSVEFEKSILKKNGEALFTKLYLAGDYNIKNELTGFNIVLVDKTEEVKAKEKLDLYLIQQDNVFKNNLIGELYYSKDENLLKANKRACSFFGYSFKGLKSIYIKDVVPEREMKELRHQINLLKSQKIDHFSMVQKFIKKDGSNVFGKVLITPIRNREKNIEYYHVLIVDITSEIIANNNLTESESKFKGIFNNAPYGIILFDVKKEVVIDCNGSALKFSGCKTIKEFSRTRLTDYLNPNELNNSEINQIYNNIKKKKNYSKVLKVKQKKGKQFYSIKLNTYRLSKPFEHIAIVNLINIDKEERTKTNLDIKNKELLKIRDELKLSTNKYKQLFNINLVGIAILDKDNQIIETNTAYYRLCGYLKNELINKSVLTLIPDFELESCKNIIRLLKTGQTKKDSFQKTYVKKDGSFMHINSYIRGFYNKANEYTGAVVSIVDISEIISITNQLKEKESRLEAIIDGSFTFSNCLSLDGQIISQNESASARDLFINPKKHKKTKFIWDSFWLDNLSESKQIVKNDFERLIKTGYTIKNQCKVKISPNAEGHIKYCFKLIKDKEGKPSWVLLEGIDITELVESKTKLSETVLELKQYIDSNLELEKFAYVASHDLKEPIRSIISFSQLLKRRLKEYDNKDVEEYIGFIISAAQNMTILIEDILTLSQAHNKNFEIEKIKMPELIDETLSAMRHTINTLKPKIQIKNLPKHMYANKTHLKQIFQNLISNCLKFSKPKIKLTIKIDSIQRKDEVEFIVTDNGIGIEEDYFNKIFLTFKQLHHKQSFEGTGIGLSICKKIVENYGGKIWVKSKPNKGSSFHFTIKKIE